MPVWLILMLLRRGIAWPYSVTPGAPDAMSIADPENAGTCFPADNPMPFHVRGWRARGGDLYFLGRLEHVYRLGNGAPWCAPRGVRVVLLGGWLLLVLPSFLRDVVGVAVPIWLQAPGIALMLVYLALVAWLALRPRAGQKGRQS